MSGFIPDDQFTPDNASTQAGFVPDHEFTPDTEKYGSTLEQLKAGAENVAAAGTFGLSTGAERLLGVSGEDIRGRKAAHEELHPYLSSAENVGGYALSALVPGVGEAGLVGAAEEAAAGGAGALARKAAMGAAEGPLTQGANAGASIMSGIAKGTVGMSLMAGGDEMSRYMSGDPNQHVGDTAANIGLSGILGATGGAALGALSPAWSAFKGTELSKKLSALRESGQDGQMSGLAKKVISSLGGVSEDNIGEYLANREAINSSPEFKEIYDEYLPRIEEIHDAVTSGKMEVSDRKSALNEISSQFKNDLVQKGFDANIADKMAKQALDTAQSDIHVNLQENALKSAPKVTEAVEALRQKVIDQSKASYGILENSGAKIDMNPFFQKGGDLADELRSRGTIEAKAMADRIDAYIDGIREQVGYAPGEAPTKAAKRNPEDVMGAVPKQSQKASTGPGVHEPSKYTPIETLRNIQKESNIGAGGKEFDEEGLKRLINIKGENNAEKEVNKITKGYGIPEKVSSGPSTIDAAKAKKLIQGLDDVSKYDFNASEFDKGLSRQYKQLRFTLDDELKNSVPEYREAMKPVADDSKLLKELKKYGDEQSSSRAVNSLKNQVNYKNEMPLLQELMGRVGSEDFLNDIYKYSNPEAKEYILKSIPEYAEKQKTAAAVQALKNPETKRAIEEAIAQTPEYKAHQEAIKALEDAIAKKEELGGINPANLESKLKSAMRGKLSVEKAIENMPEFKGKSLSEVLSNLKVKEAFEGGHTNGSKNVNLYGGILGGAAGLLGGHVMGGVASGAAVGSFMDKYGHTVTKKLLDYYIDHQGDLPKLVGKSSPSGIRFALSKMLDGVPDAGPNAFRSVAHMASASMLGSRELSKNSAKIFNGPSPDVKHPDKETLNKLDEKLKTVSQDPEHLLKNTGDLSKHLPEQAQAICQTGMTAASYLNAQRPSNPKLSPLDSEIPVSDAQKAPFMRSLAIAEQPLLALSHIKDSTLLPQDVATIKAIYPSYYNKMSQEIMTAMASHTEGGGVVPYRTRQSISMFLGQPMDSTMQPQSIQSAQGVFSQSSPSPQSAGKKSQVAQGKLSKLSESLQTPDQSRTQRLSKA